MIDGESVDQLTSEVGFSKEQEEEKRDLQEVEQFFAHAIEGAFTPQDEEFFDELLGELVNPPMELIVKAFGDEGKKAKDSAIGKKTTELFSDPRTIRSLKVLALRKYEDGAIKDSKSLDFKKFRFFALLVQRNGGDSELALRFYSTTPPPEKITKIATAEDVIAYGGNIELGQRMTGTRLSPPEWKYRRD